VRALVLLLAALGAAGGQTVEELLRTYARLTEAEIREVDRGKAVAKILPGGGEEMFVFGAVAIEAGIDSYLELATDVERLRRLPQYKAIGLFAEPPGEGDLAGFALDRQDVRALRECRPGDCEVQLPYEAMAALQRRIDWGAADVEARVNGEVRRLALEAVRRYRAGGHAALGVYQDQKRPVAVAEAFAGLLARTRALPTYLPELNAYLLGYPRARLAGARSALYWELVDFGLKPTLRINHAVAYRATAPREAHVVAIKQLYASHYFQAALDVTACVPRPGGRGFHLITLKASRQVGLTGVKGGMLRRIVEQKTRSGQEAALEGIRRALEGR